MRSRHVKGRQMDLRLHRRRRWPAVRARARVLVLEVEGGALAREEPLRRLLLHKRGQPAPRRLVEAQPLRGAVVVAHAGVALTLGAGVDNDALLPEVTLDVINLDPIVRLRKWCRLGLADDFRGGIFVLLLRNPLLPALLRMKEIVFWLLAPLVLLEVVPREAAVVVFHSVEDNVLVLAGLDLDDLALVPRHRPVPVNLDSSANLWELHLWYEAHRARARATVC